MSDSCGYVCDRHQLKSSVLDPDINGCYTNVRSKLITEEIYERA